MVTFIRNTDPAHPISQALLKAGVTDLGSLRTFPTNYVWTLPDPAAPLDTSRSSVALLVTCRQLQMLCGYARTFQCKVVGFPDAHGPPSSGNPLGPLAPLGTFGHL